MISTHERQTDILGIIENLDISPTMYKNADEKYHALAAFLEECGIEADIYPQGSFALGTVVRPSAKDPDAAYDLDFICQVHQTRDQVAPNELRKTVQTVLEGSEQYSDKLIVYDECFTIEFADIGEISFTIDIVPAVEESTPRKQELMQKSDRPDLLDTAIAIPRRNEDQNYDWMTNNPRGFRTWFEEINHPFLEFDRVNRRKKIFEANNQVFASVDDIPEGIERSAMQRVIQILKYHRDVYYLNLPREDRDDLKPISAIINTLVAEISKDANPTSSVFELLGYVLSELNIYAKRESLNNDLFSQRYGIRSAISKNENTGEWVIQNPADPEDNLANKWNENNLIPKFFFRWITACTTDLVESLALPDHEFRSIMENAFGAVTIIKNWNNKYKQTSMVAPKPITTSPKPFHV